MREIKEGKSILKMRILLRKAEFSIYVKFSINVLVFLMCFLACYPYFCVFSLSLYSTPAAIYF